MTGTVPPAESREEEYLRRLADAGITERQLSAEGASGQFSSQAARDLWRDFRDMALERVAGERQARQWQREAGDFEAGG